MSELIISTFFIGKSYLIISLLSRADAPCKLLSYIITFNDGIPSIWEGSMIKRRRILYVGVICCLALAPVCGGSAGAAPREVLKGEAFSDPARTQEMPEGWKDRPIRYDPSAGEADLVVTLDQHLYPAILGVIQEYAKKQGIKIAVSEGTCGISAGKLARKAVDMGGFCCPPGRADRLPGLRFHTLGIMPIALLVHPGNPIDNITLKEARDIFQGNVYRWPRPGDSSGQPGPGLTIQAVGRLHCKIRPGHWRLLLDNEDLFSTRLQEVGTIPDMISLIASAPGAIGYEVMMMAERYRKEGKVKALKIDGLAPNAANLLSGSYPLYRALNITTWEGEKTKNPHAQKLVDYLVNQAGNLDSKFGIVPASSLRRAGWRFKGNELVGEPK
jgi:ABC-type phosphate transport system substrate-binding protein